MDNNEILEKILFELAEIKTALQKKKKTKPPENKMEVLFNFIAKKAPVKKSDITYNLQCLGNASDIDKILSELIADGKIMVTKRGIARYYSNLL